MRKKNGFTLIELLVVVAIIGLLITLAVIARNTQRTRFRDATRITDLEQVQTFLELYFTDHNSYPASSEPLLLGDGNAQCLGDQGFAARCDKPYMAKVPKDPSAHSYMYTTPSDTDLSSYMIRATLESDSGGLSAGSIVVTPSGIANAK
ncbi:MAG TPA: hypothetical protein DCY48_01805 [Candidatus Magasanikbacteria bacterium]|nr:MAG: hypothetical protein A3I74_00715 [Candidatus Magasanikbacteria bacterium RIFCSPLOWO2_02_FULL_47_16]OGH80030.1 MAG: hypothetical protein A3C10_02510 [Candidatus Magasanikbacteria bacterium RIFCSPHIGHO2_02_FULL_48_18]OGH83278.1 MAG: hypothetical protein A3G08_02515 [Candidatus Magasanikbacteria bacterium RIFCSPLOWO2_12_FULL_47_9b]HAZ28491.1 hypothetical protein [Candidatus Magasanikbacteria bacterium]